MLTESDYRKIEAWLKVHAKKDSDFPWANTPFNGSEFVAIVLDGINKRITLALLFLNMGNIPDYPDLPDNPDNPDVPDTPDVPDNPDVPTSSYTVYFGEGDSVPTNNNQVLSHSNITVNTTKTITIDGEAKVTWLALPSGLKISSWKESTFNSDLPYSTGNKITIQDMQYTIYYYSTVVILGNPNKIVITK